MVQGLAGIGCTVSTVYGKYSGINGNTFWFCDFDGFISADGDNWQFKTFVSFTHTQDNLLVLLAARVALDSL